MEIVKLKSGTKYREMIWMNGRSVKSPLFSRKTDCQKWLQEQRAKKTEMDIYGADNKLYERISFKEYSDQWLKSRESFGLARSTISNYESYLRLHICPLIGQIDLKSIRKEDLEGLQRKLLSNHNEKGTNNVMTMVKTVFKDAHREGYILKNPAQYIPKVKENPATEVYWTRTEINQFLLFNKEWHLVDFFLLAINTGMRKGELAGLCWDRVDFSLNHIVVSRTRDLVEIKERTKTTLRRIIPMNDVARMTLLKLHAQRKGSNYVFINDEGEPIRIHHIYRDFGKAQNRAKIRNKIPFHGTRHTFATQFMMSGGNVFDLQKILGHTDIKMTMRYAHYSQDYLQKSISYFSLGNEVSQNLTNIFEAGKKADVLTLNDVTSNPRKAE